MVSLSTMVDRCDFHSRIIHSVWFITNLNHFKQPTEQSNSDWGTPNSHANWRAFSRIISPLSHFQSKHLKTNTRELLPPRDTWLICLLCRPISPERYSCFISALHVDRVDSGMFNLAPISFLDFPFYLYNSVVLCLKTFK